MSGFVAGAGGMYSGLISHPHTTLYIAHPCLEGPKGYFFYHFLLQQHMEI